MLLSLKLAHCSLNTWEGKILLKCLCCYYVTNPFIKYLLYFIRCSYIEDQLLLDRECLCLQIEFAVILTWIGFQAWPLCSYLHSALCVLGPACPSLGLCYLSWLPCPCHLDSCPPEKVNVQMPHTNSRSKPLHVFLPWSEIVTLHLFTQTCCLLRTFSDPTSNHKVFSRSPLL